jgi:hypothetical protein
MEFVIGSEVDPVFQNGQQSTSIYCKSIEFLYGSIVCFSNLHFKVVGGSLMKPPIRDIVLSPVQLNETPGVQGFSTHCGVQS